MPNKLRITYVRSAIGYNVRQKQTIRALGLRRLGDQVEHEDTPAIRGMINTRAPSGAGGRGEL
jgi:large subunit ribosomal protein L30